MNIKISALFKLLFVIMMVIAFTSCATMFSGTRADIFVYGDVDEPVTINSSYGEYKDVTLPTIVEVKRRKLDGQHIQISSEHHTFDDIVLKKAFNEWTLADALAFGYGIPIIVDLMTNAVSRPKYDQFFITPNEKHEAVDSLRETTSKPISYVAPMSRTRLQTLQLPEKYPRHEINVSIGFGSNQADHSTDRFVENITQPKHMEREGECFDLLGDSYVMGKVEYHYRLNRKWDIGAMVAWGFSSEEHTNEYYYLVEQNKKDSPGFYTEGYQRSRSFSFAPSLRYTWYETRSYRLFSRVALGMMRHHLDVVLEDWKTDGKTKPAIVNREDADKIEWKMAYQFSPIGISVGGSNLRFFAELGYGCLGVLNTGISVCF